MGQNKLLLADLSAEVVSQLGGNTVSFLFDDVASMKIFEPGAGFDGRYVQTVQYSGSTGYGGATYKVVASGTITPDEIIDHTFADGYIAQLQHEGEMSITQAGAVEDVDSTTAINAVIDAGIKAIVPLGRYLYTKTNNTTDNVIIEGVQRPSLSEDRESLVGGSILVGTLQLKGANPTIKSLGIDHGLDAFPTAKENGLVLAHANPFTAHSMATVIDVIGLCAEPEDPYHAILVEGHKDTNIDNVIGVHSFFGFALKNTRSNVSNCIARYNGSDGIIVKSDTVSGYSNEVNISNCIVEGSGHDVAPNTGYGLRITAFDADSKRVNVNNLHVSDASFAIYIDASNAGSGTVDQINISNVTSEQTERFILMDGGTGTGLIDNVKISNCTAIDINFKSIEAKNNIGMIDIDNYYSSSIVGTVNTVDTIEIGAGVEGCALSSIRLVEDGDPTNLLGVNLGNTRTHNKISGANMFNINGVGVPRQAYFEQELTAADSTVTALYDGGMESQVRITQSSAYSINTLPRTMPSGTQFPYGYQLFIYNDSGSTLTVKHNPAGYIMNTGSLDISVPGGRAILYKFVGWWNQISG